MRLKKLNTSGYRLLPYKCQKIGFIVLLATIAFTLCYANLFFPKLENIDIIRKINFNVTLISLFVIILSENRHEDELTHLIRLRSLSLAFFYGALFVIFSPYWHLLFDGKFEYQIKGEEVIFGMFGMYFFFYYLDKKGR